MRIFNPLVFTALSLLLLQGCDLFGNGSGEPSSTSGETDLDSTRAKIAGEVAHYVEEIQQLRGMVFKRKVASQVISRDTYQKLNAQSIDSSLSDQQGRFISRELSQFGFFADTVTNYKSIITEFGGGFAAGYYSRGSDTLFVLSDQATQASQLLHIIPHELVHALQDQYGRLQLPNLPPTQKENAGDVDAFQTALIEGEAFYLDALLTATYTFPQPDPKANALQVVRDTRRAGIQAWRRTQRPDNLFLPSWAPYQFGPALVGEAHQAKGWDSVEALYADPIRPSRSAITARNQSFLPFDFAPIEAALGKENAYVDSGTHGSIGLLSWVNQKMDSTQFLEGFGWRGDQYLYVLPKDSAFGKLVWVGSFDTPERAQLFQQALDTVMRLRFQGSGWPNSISLSGIPERGLTGTVLSSNLYVTSLLRSGREVYLLDHLSVGERDVVLDQLLNTQPGREAIGKKTPHAAPMSQKRAFWGNSRGKIWRSLTGIRAI